MGAGLPAEIPFRWARLTAMIAAINSNFWVSKAHFTWGNSKRA
jgi:hypothetical protein